METNDVSLEKKFRDLLNYKRMTVREFCKEVGITTTTLYDVYKRNSIDTKYLDVIEEKFKISKMYFFSDAESVQIYINGNENKLGDVNNGTSKSIQVLKKEIESKNREIELLSQIIEDKNEIIKALKGNK